MKVDIGNLRMEPIDKGEFPLSTFLLFRFFWNSPNGKAMPMLPSNPEWLAPLIAVPYMFATLAYNLGGTRYFIKRESEVAGIAVLKVHQDALIVHTLAVSPIHRKRGVGFFVLVQAEKLAKRMKLPWLELEVLKRNVPAQRLYWKFGFEISAERRLSFVLRKRV